jgi:AraC family transcriptional regulator of adaptative response/methylated-DNA-[protein]-cysteine methyltransferase
MDGVLLNERSAHAGPGWAEAAPAGDDPRWRAVAARDARADGTFVFAVRSTRVYCRPSCPARRPGRAQVVFFPSPAAAERAGYRACRRCRPQDAGASDRGAALVEQACRYIEEHLDSRLDLAGLTQALRRERGGAGPSPRTVRRLFQRSLGLTPRQYADARRLESVRTRLRAQDGVATALYDAGFGSSSRLYERAPAHLGMTPATYRRGGRGMRIGYTITASPIGRLLVAATERGLCAVRLGDSDAALEAGLRAEYPAAEVRRDENGLGAWVAILRGYLWGHARSLALPLDIQATAFQRKVWDALSRIPYGATRSYGEVAHALGRPTAARAVARACAANPVALVIPCHRVVRENGDLGGYRWGVDRKRALLEQERMSAAR